MRRHITGIDHCFILVRDLENARANYARLGFTTSPLGRHGSNRGTGNHTIMLDDDYFELLGVLERTDLSQKWLDRLEVGEGLSSIALRTDDAEAAIAEMHAMCVFASDPVTFSRPVDLPDGSQAEARFTTMRIPEAMSPHVSLFCCQHLTPENTWIPALMKHANTAYGIDHITVATPTPDADARRAARLFDTVPERLGDEALSVATGSAPILYMTMSALALRYAGADLGALPPAGPAVLSLKVHDAAAAAACLRRTVVAFAVTNAGLLVPPQETCGVLLALRAA